MNRVDYDTSTNLKSLIRNKGLMVSYVAEKCGYDTKKFSALINGRKKLTPLDVMKICDGLKVTPNEVFGFDETV